MPPPRQPPPPTTTLGPPHCVADALPTTSPIAPFPAATLEAELRTPASTRPESTQMPRRHRPRGPNAPAPSLNPENELSVTNGGTGDNSRRIPACPEAASLANQSSLRLAASSSTHSASPSGARPRPSASPMGCPSICVRRSRKPRTSNARSIAMRTEVFLSRSIASFSVHATSRSSLARRSSPSHTANDIVKASTCLRRKTSMIKGIGAGGLDDRSEGMPGVGEKREDPGGPADDSRPHGLLLGPAPEGGEARRFPRTIAEDTLFPFGNAGQNLEPCQSSRKEKSTTLMTPVPDATPAPTLELLTPTVVHHHLVQIGGRDYWNAGGRHDKIWETPGGGDVTTRPPKPRTSSINPPNPQKNPDTPPNFRPCPAPISANSDASPANSNGPLANFGAFPAATDTYPGSPEPQEPPLLFLIFATHHQLNTLVPPTYSGVSRQPRGNPHSPMIPSTYQHGPILNRNRHPPAPSSSAKPCRRS
ncbi:hypothetical protein E4T56_gene18227 [Termitomyces sp. T112]|nr:hypothetical protein E4T56_gene18227 [Termitomyces sp. T112]